MTSNMATQQPSSASNQSVQVDLLPRPTTMPINFGSQQLPSDGRETSQALVQASVPTSRPNPLIFSNKQPMEMLRSPKDQISKSVFPGLQQPERGSKLHAGIEPFPKLQNQAPVNAGESFPITSNKQKAQMESLQKLQTTLPRTAGSQLSSMVNKRPGQTELPVKVQTGFGSVRSKLRESLASALATGSKEQNEPKLLEKKSIGDCKEADSIFNEQAGHEKDDIVMDDVPFSDHNIMEDELLQGHGLHWASDFDSVNADPMQNSSLKRPKLMNVAENNDTKDTILKASEKLSVLIEAELFKLFGGVNKKYKEKGRSLLFNLKDLSNPELRERVLSGEVSPERLCSMTAEELASKELSQWRQAKAEEFAQMVVLPDMNIDIRRLVKKTHKGEFQVEFDQDDGAHVEVGLGSDAPSKMLAKSNDVDQSQPRSSDKSDSNGRNVSSSLDHRLPEKTDYIQDIMVEGLKDTELLPSVVSLDEFMQALDSEPPFENMEVNNLQENLSSVDRNLERSDSESIHPHDSSGHMVDSTQGTKSHSGRIHTKHAKEISSSNNGQVDCSYQKSDDKLKTDGAYAKYITEIPDSASKCNIIWEGFLQLNVSALSNVVSFFLSGERISMQEWPSLLEVKGRVRLDAFEKFLQELPLSRSRTIMLVEFRWKEGSLESGRAHFSEAVHSYITDERLGFAEPAPGVELYLCPSHPKITGILTSHLSKELLDSISCVVNGLIGIVVWRRPPVAASPRVSSHHRRHGGSKKHSGSKKRQESLKHSSHRIPMPRPDEEDDVPPGFGPRPVVKVDDDLPEFDFSGGRTSHRAGAARASSHALPAPAAAPASASPSDHMRELIQKYGQGGSTVGRELGIPVQPWNDDDDIPEWNPNQNTKKMPQSMPLPPPPPPPPQLHLYQQQQSINTQPFGINQNLMPPQYMQAPPPPPIQPPVGVMQPNNAMRWPGPRGMPDGCLRPHGGGQLSGGRPPGPVVAPRMVQGIGGVRNGLGFWRPDNSSGSRGI